MKKGISKFNFYSFFLGGYFCNYGICKVNTARIVDLIRPGYGFSVDADWLDAWYQPRS